MPLFIRISTACVRNPREMPYRCRLIVSNPSTAITLYTTGVPITLSDGIFMQVGGLMTGFTRDYTDLVTRFDPSLLSLLPFPAEMIILTTTLHLSLNFYSSNSIQILK